MRNNIIFAFIGGAIVGVFSTFGIMTKLGYTRSDPNDDISKEEEKLPDISPKKTTKKEGQKMDSAMLRDTPSFTQSESIDTHKVSYDGIVNKPSLEEVSKKYMNQDFDRHMAEHEHPEEDDVDPDDFDEIEEGENDLVSETEAEELYNTGYGTVIKELPARRKDDLIFLVPQAHAGEIYLLDELIYYAGDDVLSDTTDTPVGDPLAVIGDSLGYFGQYGADQGKLFVRNVSLGIEYEVTYDPGRYADHLYGVDTMPETAQPSKRKSKKRKQEE